VSNKFDILSLNKQEVIDLGGGDMKLAIEDMEEVLSLRSKGETITPHKVAMGFGKTIDDEVAFGRINAMPGYVKGKYNMAGIKWIGSNPKNVERGIPRASGITIINDPDTKFPVAIMDGTIISAARTGAIGGVAVKYLSKNDSKIVTLIGAGVQNRTQLEAAVCTRPSINEIYVYDLYYDRAVNFADEMSKKLNRSITPIKSLEEYCKKSDIIITATVSKEPIVEADWIMPGTTCINVGGYEYTFDAVRKAQKVVVDTWEDVKHRMASTIAIMANEGLFADEEIYAEIGEIVIGDKIGRENDQEIIYYNSVGMGIEDVAIATRVYRTAQEKGIGTKLIYW
jgi:2,3-diaminopropionate biosynthesis protein SbnB